MSAKGSEVTFARYARLLSGLSLSGEAFDRWAVGGGGEISS
jgi:hypothetical protein